jgi:hypothetical protein
MKGKELMTRQLVACISIGIVIVGVAGRRADAQFAAEVLSYNAGSTAAPCCTVPAAALGSPERMTGSASFPSVVSPFSPPYLANQIVSVGLGGQLTLRLSHYALPQGAGPEIGVFTNVGIADANYPNGEVGPLVNLFSVDRAAVDVSANGADWVSLGAPTFNIPSNGFTDLSDPYSAVPGGVPSDFQQPFASGPGSFVGRPYSHATDADLLDLYAGSGGGTWLDISASGLSQVGYIRFRVPDDIGEIFKFELDAVSIAHGALGALTVPEPGAISLSCVALLTVFRFRRTAPFLRRRAVKLALAPTRSKEPRLG